MRTLDSGYAYDNAFIFRYSSIVFINLTISSFCINFNFPFPRRYEYLLFLNLIAEITLCAMTMNISPRIQTSKYILLIK